MRYGPDNLPPFVEAKKPVKVKGNAPLMLPAPKVPQPPPRPGVVCRTSAPKASSPFNDAAHKAYVPSLTALPSKPVNVFSPPPLVHPTMARAVYDAVKNGTPHPDLKASDIMALYSWIPVHEQRRTGEAICAKDSRGNEVTASSPSASAFSMRGALKRAYGCYPSTDPRFSRYSSAIARILLHLELFGKRLEDWEFVQGRMRTDIVNLFTRLSL